MALTSAKLTTPRDGPARWPVEDVGVPASIDPELTVIVPTRNESGNVAELLRRLRSGCDGMSLQVIFVDDSEDDTPEVIRASAPRSQLQVSLLHRPLGQRSGGLGGAVVAGLQLARSPWVVVMDSDLQHPPELAPMLVAAGQQADAQLVVASRYVDKGSRAGLASASRRAASGSATLLTKGTFPRRLAKVTDPMSGFFAIRMSAIDPSRLRPIGFKILLEIVVRSPRLRIVEVPFDFAPRFTGESKASIREGLRFVRHLLRLRRAVLLTQLTRRANRPITSRVLRGVAFGLVGVSGIAVNVAALWLLSAHMMHLNYLVAAALATQISTSWNFVLTDRLVFRGPKLRRWWGRAVPFFLINNGALLLRLPLLALLVERLGFAVLPGNVVTLALLFVLRFVLSDRVIYRREGTVPEISTPQNEEPDVFIDVSASVVEPELAPVDETFTQVPQAIAAPPTVAVHQLVPRQAEPADSGTGLRRKNAGAAAGSRAAAPILNGNGKGSGKDPIEVVHDYVNDARQLDSPLTRRGSHYLPYRYDIAGVLRVGSHVALRELEYFRDQSVGRDVDIAVRVGPVGNGPRNRATMTQFLSPPAARYQEHLGRLGANFRIEFNDRIDVTVGPLLAHSPHVLYTNVIEALLRFVLVDRGYMLLHSACFELDGVGVMLSARTDTGKTGTILRLLREKGARFLSDDMTIVSPTGRAMCFPKPLTISQHTLRAIDMNELTKKEWAKLRVQSRVHSKEGRLLGFLIGQLNLPIMAVNSTVQKIVPPPKYAVDRLVPCDVIPAVDVQQLFIIARGDAEVTEIAHEEAIGTLLENTEDAYGFPPFKHFAPAVVIGGADYTELQQREREILSSAISRVRIRGVSSPNFSWADDIPMLLARDREAALEGRPAATAAGALPTMRPDQLHTPPSTSSNGHRVEPPGVLTAQGSAQ
jgi:dolichol-phosphate mannosyltransferase